MRKFRLYYDKDKEEEWLNEMCSKGWAMTKFFLGVYTFEPCSPGKYTYQVDLPDTHGKIRMGDGEKREYIDFVESTGAEYVCSWGFYVIFRKEAEKGTFKLYTDAESKIGLYRRIRLLFLVVGLMEFGLAIGQTANYLHIEEGLWDPGINIFLWSCLGVIYLIILVLLVMVIRITRKIHRLKYQK